MHNYLGKNTVQGVEAHLGERLRSVRPLGGGCIGEAYRVELEDGTALVAKADPAGEAYVLRCLREKSGLPVSLSLKVPKEPV